MKQPLSIIAAAAAAFLIAFPACKKSEPEQTEAPAAREADNTTETPESPALAENDSPGDDEKAAAQPEDKQEEAVKPAESGETPAHCSFRNAVSILVLCSGASRNKNPVR